MKKLVEKTNTMTELIILLGIDFYSVMADKCSISLQGEYTSDNVLKIKLQKFTYTTEIHISNSNYVECEILFNDINVSITLT